jgi:hypothetical protein
MTYTVHDLDKAVTKWARTLDEPALDKYDPWTEGCESQSPEEFSEYSEVWGELSEYLYFWEDSPQEVLNKRLDLPGIGSLQLLEIHGGGEGDGGDYHLIVRVVGVDGARVFKRCGWYASYDGGYLDGPTIEGKQVVKAVTVFEVGK